MVFKKEAFVGVVQMKYLLIFSLSFFSCSTPMRPFYYTSFKNGVVVHCLTEIPESYDLKTDHDKIQAIVEDAIANGKCKK